MGSQSLIYWDHGTKKVGHCIFRQTIQCIPYMSHISDQNISYDTKTSQLLLQLHGYISQTSRLLLTQNTESFIIAKSLYFHCQLRKEQHPKNCMQCDQFIKYLFPNGLQEKIKKAHQTHLSQFGLTLGSCFSFAVLCLIQYYEMIQNSEYSSCLSMAWRFQPVGIPFQKHS